MGDETEKNLTEAIHDAIVALGPNVTREQIHDACVVVLGKCRPVVDTVSADMETRQIHVTIKWVA